SHSSRARRGARRNGRTGRRRWRSPLRPPDCRRAPTSTWVTSAAATPRSRGHLYVPVAKRTRIGVHIMHPRTDQSFNYNVPPLVEAGCMVLARAGRWVNNDTDTVHETLLFDVAAGVRLLRERGCDTVVLLGNSGG